MHSFSKAQRGETPQPQEKAAATESLVAAVAKFSPILVSAPSFFRGLHRPHCHHPLLRGHGDYEDDKTLAISGRLC